MVEHLFLDVVQGAHAFGGRYVHHWPMTLAPGYALCAVAAKTVAPVHAADGEILGPVLQIGMDDWSPY